MSTRNGNLIEVDLATGSISSRTVEALLTPTAEGPAAGSVPDIELMMKEYYELRGLGERGFPKREKLEAVGLSDVASRLHR